jgi:hypothetical protein
MYFEKHTRKNVSIKLRGLGILPLKKQNNVLKLNQ